MINSIKADIYRIFHAKTVWLVFFIVLILQMRAVFTMDTADLFSDSYFDPFFSDGFIVQAKDSLRNDIRVMSYNYGILIEIIFTTGALITSLFSEGLLKNSITSGMSMGRFPLMKTAAVLYINLFLLFFQNLIVFIVNIICNGQENASYFPDVLLITFWQAFPVICWSCFLILVAALMRRYSYYLASVFVPLVSLSRGIRAGYYQPRVIMGFITYEPYDGFRIKVALLSVAVSILSVFLFFLAVNRKGE
ncbi:MAG: hypothetical protein K6F49_11920 [Saccharofermentans sp.]|nr:hypothetical protein [Saccharofermentans sp.]